MSAHHGPKNEADIYCPKCRWRPSAEDRWECMPSCGTVWNTFWTRGVCPGCAYQWQETQCHVCQRLSPHEQWYHYREPAEVVAKEAEDTLQA